MSSPAFRIVLTPSPDEERATAGESHPDYPPIELRSGPERYANCAHHPTLYLRVGAATYALLNPTEAIVLARALLAWAGVP